MGGLYIIFSIITYVVYLLSFQMWVYLVVFGGFFVMWILPIVVAVINYCYDFKLEVKN